MGIGKQIIRKGIGEIMTEYERGYLDGLNAAALCCEYSNGKNRVSRMAERIRACAQAILLKIELTPPDK